MSRRTVPPWALLGVILAIASCGVPLESSPRTVSSDDVPAGLRPIDPVESTLPVQLETIEVWFVREGMLASVRHRVASPVDSTIALADLLAGPSDAERERSFRSAIPDASAVVAVTVSGGSATVQLAETFSEIPASDQVLAVGQMVLTLTDLRGIGRVRFVRDGTDVTVPVPLPGGGTSEISVSRDDYSALIEDV